MISVPFKMVVHNGFANAHGLLRLADGCLVVEFEVKDAMAGLIKAQHKVSLPIAVVDDVQFLRGWFGGKLRVRVADLTALDEISWRTGHEFEVKVRRRDRELAAEFAEAVAWVEEPE